MGVLKLSFWPIPLKNSLRILILIGKIPHVEWSENLDMIGLQADQQEHPLYSYILEEHVEATIERRKLSSQANPLLDSRFMGSIKNFESNQS